MNDAADLERQLSRALLQLRAKNPFFATLALFAHLEWRAVIATAATDGRAIVFNPAFAATLTPAEFQAVLLHEVLHCALLHVTRRGSREPALWNIAADIVVNGMIAPQADLNLPADAIREPQLEQLAVEEVYEALLAPCRRVGATCKRHRWPGSRTPLIPPPPAAAPNWKPIGKGRCAKRKWWRVPSSAARCPPAERGKRNGSSRRNWTGAATCGGLSPAPPATSAASTAAFCGKGCISTPWTAKPWRCASPWTPAARWTTH